MTMARTKAVLSGMAYERSAADRKADKAGAKKAGVSQKKWEGSAADRKADAKAKRKGK